MITYHMSSARKGMAAVVTPLLKLISNVTGFECLTLLAGEASKQTGEKVAIGAIHYGKKGEVHPRDFGNYDPPAYKAVLQQFARFVEGGKS